MALSPTTHVQTQMKASITKCTPRFYKANTNDPYNFAILELEAPEQDDQSKDTPKEYHYVFNLDRSGSMAMPTPSDHSTKMEQTIHTLTNIIAWMVKDTHNKHYMTILLFDDEVETITTDVLINSETSAIIIGQLQKVRPRGYTNIELALTEANKVIDTLLLKSYTNIIHLFMTDGNPTDGNMDSNTLATLSAATKSKSTDYYIGFGLDHNSPLLQKLAGTHDKEYHFADNLETCGMVYSDILHSFIYNYEPTIILKADGLEFYNYKTNKWENNYTVPNLAYNTTKTYHVRQLKETRKKATLAYSIPNKDPFKDPFQPEFQPLELTFKPDDNVRVENYMWRQKTLEILYKIQKDGYSEKKANTFLKQLKVYMKTTDQASNTFLQTLVDDIYVAILVKDTEYQDMYTHTRQSSQGGQRGYTVKNVMHLLTIDRTEDMHEFSQSSSTNYGSLNLRNLTRSVSQANPLTVDSSPITRTRTYTPASFISNLGSIKRPKMSRSIQREIFNRETSNNSPTIANLTPSTIKRGIHPRSSNNPFRTVSTQSTEPPTTAAAPTPPTTPTPRPTLAAPSFTPYRQRL
jgi:hypothetical protein